MCVSVSELGVCESISREGTTHDCIIMVLHSVSMSECNCKLEDRCKKTPPLPPSAAHRQFYNVENRLTSLVKAGRLPGVIISSADQKERSKSWRARACASVHWPFGSKYTNKGAKEGVAACSWERNSSSRHNHSVGQLDRASMIGMW